VLNAQSGVGTTLGRRQYVTTGWRYRLPHTNKYLLQAGQMLQEERVDLALCVELSEHSLTSGFKSQTEIMREASGLSNSTFFSASRLYPFLHEGLAVITRYPIKEAQTHLLPRGLFQRVMGEVVIEIDHQTNISVFVTHLALGEKAREEQCEAVAEIVGKSGNPVILGGDFNTKDTTWLTERLPPGLRECSDPTFPAWRPRVALQRLFFNEEIRLREVWTAPARAFSDHLPLLVQIEL